MGFKAKYHAAVVSHNINQLANNKTKLKEYKPLTMRLMIASIGRNNGIFQLGPFAFKGFLPTSLKSKDLFLPKYRGMLGYNDNNEGSYYLKSVAFIIGVALIYWSWNVYSHKY